MLFVAARVSHFSRLPQGRMEARERVLRMVDMMDKLGFGNCTNTGACEAECPKQISISHIAKLNREYLSARII
jgi:succinate dehydrogenase / fumarate reductase iron-sulfur subunit